ncbi:uncharacterized protein LOC124305073 isoform X1 [Neodiprion virginianus]|uniref:uncharacterized protein LOC124305073 isoform X1 n=1 Tax=Neodiprion virginianus TaxID=2961670 RepID=UPI001EE76D35|nr:uncharacterized protein LOC124305073 isoform X1 [Neodiprion virginianus]
MHMNVTPHGITCKRENLTDTRQSFVHACVLNQQIESGRIASTCTVVFCPEYVTVRVNPGDKSDKCLILKPTVLHHAIQQKVELMYGDFGLSAIKSGFNAKYFNHHTRIALIKIRHGPHRLVIDSVRAVSEIDSKIASLDIIYVGATMKHCFQFIQRYQRKKLEKMWTSLKNYEKKTEMKDDLMTITPIMKEFK